MRRTIDTLPVGNRAIIDRVCAMFSIIQEFSDVNKMTAKNIALVMNPSMFRDKEGSMRELVSTGGLRVRLVQLLILNHKELFCVSFCYFAQILFFFSFLFYSNYF